MGEKTTDEEVKLIENAAEYISEHGLDHFDKEKYREAIRLLRLVRHYDMFDELQSVRTKYIQVFPLSKDELNEWYDDLVELDENEEKWKLLSDFFEDNIVDNKSTWFYSLYVQFATDMFNKGQKDANGNLVYTRGDVDLILDDALQKTAYDFQKSHILWDQFYEFHSRLEAKDVIFLKNHFLERLKVPHKFLDQTFEQYSSFVSENFNDRYQQEMKQANVVYAQTQKQQWDIESWELKRSSYVELSQYFVEYLGFLLSKPKKQRKIEHINSLFENAIQESQDNSFITVWVKYIHALYEFEVPNDSITVITERFIKHHPNSSAAYAEFYQNLPAIPDSESISLRSSRVKRRVDSLGILNNIAYDQWQSLICSYLAFLSKLFALDSEKFAETFLIHIESYFKEAIQKCNDVYHSVERLCILYEEQIGEIDAAKDHLRQLTEKFGSEAENWLLSHNFEKIYGDYNTASKVLSAAISRAGLLDWPERIFQEALSYERVYGTVESYRRIVVRIDKKAAEIRSLRQNAMEGERLETSEKEQISEEPEKRKAEESFHDDESSEHKKRKLGTHRDREHLTILVKNLPLGTNEQQITNFFKDCGSLKDHHLVEKDDQIHAKIELTDEQAVLRALTKDHKRFHGSEIRVLKAFQTTVWVTNFPPSYDSEAIKSLFSRVGEVANVRFPSLKFNSLRRFCYVEFLESKDASKSVNELNKKDLDGYELIVKISDPESKVARTGAVEEKRELFVSKLDFYKVTSEKVKQLFQRYGTVERVNLPLSKSNKDQGRKHDGYGFVTFSTPEEAEAALELNLVALEGRAIEVSISKKKSERVQRKENSALNTYRSANNVIALLKVPDTINGNQLERVCSEAGAVENVILEPEYGGAIVEFKDASETGQAALKLDGKALGNYTFQVGTVQDLRGNNIKIQPTASRPMIPSTLRRKKAFQKTQGPSKTEKESANRKVDGISAPTGRSNEDFRAILLGKK